MKQSPTARKMPTRRQIAEYWNDRFIAKGWEIDFEIVNTPQCFSCGRKNLPLQRAHIKSRFLGGSDSIENLHVLCVACHAESEFLDGLKYWRWYRHKRLAQWNGVIREEMKSIELLYPELVISVKNPYA
jgi:hypothetical protein